MSAPISSFRKLSISTQMEAAERQGRGQNENQQRHRTPVNAESSTDDYSSSEDETGSEEEGGITGNPHVLALDHCRQYGSRYAFQMVDAEIRSCGIRLDETMNMPSCSCNEGESCRHVQWLLQKLDQVRKSSPTKRPTRPHAYITSKGLKPICKLLKWEVRDEHEEEVQEYPWALQKDYAVQDVEPQAQQNRKTIVRDLLATFSKTVTEDFRRDIFDAPIVLDENSTYMTGDLEGTLARLLLTDTVMFNTFKERVTPDMRASRYFQNMKEKAFKALKALDDYCHGGPLVVGGDFDIIWCAQELTNIVRTINENISTRQPLQLSTRTEAASALISILATVVVHRNHDVYQDLTWQRQRRHGEPQIDRNLYARLIGCTTDANPSGGSFVISALMDLPEARVFVDQLEDVLTRLESIGWSAPRAYTEKLRGIIARLKRSRTPALERALTPSAPGSSGGSGGTGGSGKRAAAAAAGDARERVKRMK